MRLLTFRRPDGVTCLGALAADEQTLVDLQSAARAKSGRKSPHLHDMLSFLSGGEKAKESAEAAMEFARAERPPEAEYALASVQALAPLPRPQSIRDCLCFEDHIINAIRVIGMGRLASLDEWVERTFGRKRSLAYRANRAFYERPLYYKSNCFSVVGTGEDVRIPPYTRQFDYELEFGVFIGKQGADIPKSRAREYIGGYTVFNDFSARDMQRKEQRGRLGPTKGKDFDTGNAMGPWLVTPEEIPDPYRLTMRARVNGQEWSRGTSADMYWSFEDLVEYISRSETLYPGEFLGSGTCSGKLGKGCGLELGRFLHPGDLVELEVEGIGVLRNRVVDAEIAETA